MNTRTVRRRLAEIEASTVYAAVGKLIRARRHQLGATIEQLAEACSVSRWRVMDWEAGRTRIALHRLAEIADALDCPLTDLIPADHDLPVPYLPTKDTTDD